MLVSGGVHDEEGLCALHQRKHTVIIAHRADIDLKVKVLAVLSYELLLYLIGVVFVNIDDNEL